MTAALDIIASNRRGACPTLDAPMQTGDGLLARIRVKGGTLAPRQLSDLARLAALHGNGLVEITARGNLQARGLTPVSAPHFARDVAALIAVETGLVIDTSPLAQVDPQQPADPLPIADAIRSGAADFGRHLGPKVSVVIDGNGQIPLSSLKADIRLLARGADLWSVTLGDSKPQLVDAATAVEMSLSTLRALAAIGPDARATDLFPGSVSKKASHPLSALQPWASEALSLGTGTSSPVALPFGAADSTMLSELADAAVRSGVTTFRLAPGHSLLIDNAPVDLIAVAAALGFITSATDPRRRISACIGTDGCASGYIAARRLAARLASHLPSQQTVHVSGCSKGCAHPRPANITLVGRPNGIGLVIAGRAGDTPSDILNEAGLGAALVARQDGR